MFNSADTVELNLKDWLMLSGNLFKIGGESCNKVHHKEKCIPAETSPGKHAFA
jgi:hypothetical protein